MRILSNTEAEWKKALLKKERVKQIKEDRDLT